MTSILGKQADMSDEEFTNYKEALIADKLERDHTLIEETDRHWEQIWEQRYSVQLLFPLDSLQLRFITHLRPF